MENSTIIIIILIVVGFIFKDKILEFISKSGLTGTGSGVPCPDLSGNWNGIWNAGGGTWKGVLVRTAKKAGTKQTYDVWNQRK